MRVIWITNDPFIPLLQIRNSDDLFIITIIINDIFDRFKNPEEMDSY